MTNPTLHCELKSFNALYAVSEVYSKESRSPCRHREDKRSAVSMSAFKHGWITYKHLSPSNIFPGGHSEKLLKDKSLTNHISSPLKTLKVCYKAWSLSPSPWPTRVTFICIWSHSPTLSALCPLRSLSGAHLCLFLFGRLCTCCFSAGTNFPTGSVWCSSFFSLYRRPTPLLGISVAHWCGCCHTALFLNYVFIHWIPLVDFLYCNMQVLWDWYYIDVSIILPVRTPELVPSECLMGLFIICFEVLTNKGLSIGGEIHCLESNGAEEWCAQVHRLTALRRPSIVD